MPNKIKKAKKPKVVNKNKNQINIVINSHNKKKTSNPRRQPQSSNPSIFVSSPGVPYLPQDSSVHHLYPILQNLSDKINAHNHIPVSHKIEAVKEKKNDEVVSTSMTLTPKPADWSSYPIKPADWSSYPIKPPKPPKAFSSPNLQSTLKMEKLFMSPPTSSKINDNLWESQNYVSRMKAKPNSARTPVPQSHIVYLDDGPNTL